MPGGRRSLRNRNKDRCPYKTQLSGASLRGGGLRLEQSGDCYSSFFFGAFSRETRPKNFPPMSAATGSKRYSLRRGGEPRPE